MTRHDLESRSDIDSLMQLFYSRAMSDPLIGSFFTDVVALDLQHHLPIIGDFWESLLLGAPAYRRYGRNPLQIHAALDARERLLPQHFERWLELFSACVDELFSGVRAEFAKTRGQMIARRMMDYLLDCRAAESSDSAHAAR